MLAISDAAGDGQPAQNVPLDPDSGAYAERGQTVSTDQHTRRRPALILTDVRPGTSAPGRLSLRHPDQPVTELTRRGHAPGT
jgi:hypothetical protein